MTITEKIDKAQDLITEITVELASQYQPREDDDEGHEKLNTVFEHLDATNDSIYDLRRELERFNLYIAVNYDLF